MEEMDVSVVMAVRNGADHLAAALHSIAGAGRRPREILVLDGASTDGSDRIARANPLVRLVRQQGIGIAAAYNQAIAASRGSIIAFLSCDDLWTPGGLDQRLAVLASQPATQIVFGYLRHELAGTPAPNFRLDLIGRVVPGLVMETMVARRTVFGEVGPFDERLSTAEDVDWIARARDIGIRMVTVPQLVLVKRVHAGNSSLIDPIGDRALLQALRHTARRRRHTAG
jgi:glycosyltransferase involved in cell wall biosynthesis